jgi:transposase
LDEQALLEDVRRYPDKLLRERAEDFSMSINGIWVALKRLGIKKNAEI